MNIVIQLQLPQWLIELIQTFVAAGLPMSAAIGVVVGIGATLTAWALVRCRTT